MESLIRRAEPSLDHRHDLEAIGREAEHVGRRPLAHDLARLQHHDLAGKPRDLLNGMADVDDGDAELVAQGLDQRQDFQATRCVERSKRLVHQQQAWRGKQRPPQGNALLFAAAQRRWMPIEQVTDTERLDHRSFGDPSLVQRRKQPTIAKIAPDGEVRKQPRLLKHHADTAAMGRHVASLSIGQDRSVDEDSAGAKPRQAGNDLDHRRLAGAGRAKQRGDAIAAGEVDIELKVAEALVDLDIDHEEVLLNQRAMTSEATRAARPIEAAITERRSASPSPSGLWLAV